MRFLFFIYLLVLTLNASATTYWVKKTGSDSNTCIGEANACLTINKGLSLTNTPGDTLYIGAGTYIEDSRTSPYIVGGQGCGTLDGAISSLCMFHSGTLANPIIISAAIGQERQVIVDSQYARSGISLTKSDYIVLKNIVFKNNWIGGIVNPGGPAPTTGPQLDSNLSIGCLIEGNVIDGVETPYGVNASGIYFWSTKDWIIRNNYISIHSVDPVFRPNGMQTYGTINALIEYNTIVDTDKGIFLKDHYIASANPTTHVQESVIRNNLIIAKESGVLLLIRGTNTNPAGNNEIYNNLIEMVGQNTTGVASGSGAHSISGSLNVHNNIFTFTTNTSTYAASISSSTNFVFNNNIVMGAGNGIRCGYSVTSCNLNASNYNIYDSRSTFVMDNGAGSERQYYSLAAWQAADETNTVSLNTSSPDINSVIRSYTDFKKYSVRFYKNYDNSVGGQKAGFYLTGPETVGANFKYKANPRSPN